MTKTQKHYIKVRLGIIGGLAALVLAILGICYDWWIIQGLIALGCLAMVGFMIAVVIGEIVYRWRVMGATADDEQELFDRYWHFIIREGRMEEVIEEILSGERYDDWDEETKEFVVKYLYKIKEVKIPKILTI